MKSDKKILEMIEDKFNATYCGGKMPVLQFSMVEHFIKIALKEKE